MTTTTQTFIEWIDAELTAKAYRRFDALILHFGPCIQGLDLDCAVDALDAAMIEVNANRQDSPLTGKEVRRLIAVGLATITAMYLEPITAWVEEVCMEARGNAEKAVA